jgi:DNA-binding response OmpR family regulator
VAGIAVANDDTAFLHLMEDLLVDAGYRVRLHSTTDSILDTLISEPPDLLILILWSNSGMQGCDSCTRSGTARTLPICP